MGFLYETHLHTCQSSACGRSTGREHVRFYKDLGYTGIFVTDHFFGGNTAIPRELPWEEWVDRFCGGFEDAWEEGQRVGLDVFFAWEETFNGDDYLIYGLDRDWLKAHPEVRSWSHKEQYETVHRDGGCVIQAHPFRIRDYIQRIYLCDRYVDGVEVANAGNDAFSDVYALRYAKEHHFVMTCGSDNHYSAPGVENRIFGVELPEKLTCAKDYVRMILNHAPIGLHCPESRFDPAQGKPLTLDPFYINDDETVTAADVRWY